MSDAPTGQQYEVTCPHCRKPFAAPLIAGNRGHLRGFKCPHCRLYVPQDRAVEPASN